MTGGTQIRPLELFTRFAELGHRVEVIETDRQGAPWSAGTLSVTPVATPRRGALGLAQRVRELRRRLRSAAREADAAGDKLCYYTMVPSGVVFKHGILPVPTHPGALLLSLAKRVGATTWAAVHDLSPDQELDILARAGETWKASERRRVRASAAFRELQQRVLLPQADFVSVVAPPMRNALIERYGLDPSRLEVFWSGVAPGLLEPIPAWTPPQPGQPWRVGYLGSPLDLSFELLARSLSALGPERTHLLLGGVDASRHAARARAHFPHVEAVDGVRYADYASFAERIDLWPMPFDDSYYLKTTWELKLPLALGSGRPVVRTDGPVVETSDLRRHIWRAPSDAPGFASVLAEVMAAPAQAQERAAEARRDVLARYTWAQLADKLLAKLNAV